MNQMYNFYKTYISNKYQSKREFNNKVDVEKITLKKNLIKYCKTGIFYQDKEIIYLCCKNLIKTQDNIKSLTVVAMLELYQSRLNELSKWIYKRIDDNQKRIASRIYSKIIITDYKENYSDKIKLIKTLYNLAVTNRKNEIDIKTSPPSRENDIVSKEDERKDEEDDEEDEEDDEEDEEEEDDKTIDHLKPKLSLAEYIYRYFRYTKSIALMDSKAFKFNELFNNTNIEPKDKISLITSYCQVGKTFLVVPVSLVYLALDFTPIMVVLDSAQVYQIIQRINFIVKELSEHLITVCGFHINELKMFEKVLFYDSHNHIDGNLNMAIDGSLRHIIIANKHHTHIRRINDIITENSNIVIVADEAQSSGCYKYLENDKGDYHDLSVKYELEFVTLKDVSKKCIYVSATAQDILVVDSNLWSDNITYISPNDYYTGLKDCVFKNIEPKEDITDFTMKILEELSVTKPIIRVDKRHNKTDLHPINVLAKINRKIEYMYAFVDKFANDEVSDIIKESKWTVCSFTGEGIRFFNADMKENLVCIQGKQSILMENGVHLFKNDFNQINITDFYQFIADEGVDKCPRILTCGYDMICEAMSLISHYDKPNNYHLTHGIFNMSKTCTSANAIQSSCRLLGNHGDDIKPIIYTHQKTKEKILKGYELNDKINSDLLRISENGNDNVSCSQYLKEFEVYSNRIPTLFTKQTIKATFNKIENPNKKIENRMLKKDNISGIDYLACVEPEKYKIDIEIERNVEDTSGKIDGVSLQNLKKWFNDTTKNLIVGRIIRFLYGQHESVSIEKLKDDIEYNGSVEQLLASVKNGMGEKGAQFGLLWIYKNKKIRINKNIKKYIDEHVI